MLNLDFFIKYNSKQRYQKISPYILGSKVLDVGCAEGWIGHFLTNDKGYDVSLVDVVNLNKTDLNFSLYDGENLPFENASFDTVLILLTLHHCQRPDKTLLEALRVSKKRIIITESVYYTRLGKMLLKLMDGGFNGIRSGDQISTPLHFKTSDQWLRHFSSIDLSVVEKKWLSFGAHNQILYVLEKSGV